MSKKRSDQPTVSEQLRQLIASSVMSRYEIAMQTGVSQAALSRFMSGERGLTTLTVDRLGILFDLEIVPRARKRA
jgi:transcriptional regulator with XRE-family HTH domain